MSTVLRDAGRYYRTVRHLRLEQVAHRIRLRARQTVLRKAPQLFESRWRHPGDGGHWPESFHATDWQCPPHCGPVHDLLEDRFTFLNESRSLGDPPEWNPDDKNQLWLYHQHYWEWAWTLARHDDKAAAGAVFARQFASWNRSTMFGRWNAWAPYPTSLRTWVFLNVAQRLGAGTSIEDDLRESLRLHAGFVAHNLELDVGGNHLIKNLKALIGSAVYFADESMLTRGLRILDRQLERQVLPDGGHFELSPSYHCQVLGDLLDVRDLLVATSHPGPSRLDAAVTRMQRWLGVMLMPDGDVPLFNDAERVGPDRIAVLGASSADAGPLTVLPDSGYVVAKPGERIHLVADVGQPCPPELPAHAQADCLSFELAVDGERVIVDPGTSEYGSGTQRRWERSTVAHNTVTVDGQDQTEVWGSFRAGRRATAYLDFASAEGDTVTIRAHHDGYRHLPGSPTHHRTWNVSLNHVAVHDLVEGTGLHRLNMRILIPHPAEPVGSAQVDTQGCRVAVGAGLAARISTSTEACHAVGHGHRLPATALEAELVGLLPTSLTTQIEIRRAPECPTESAGMG